MLTELYIEKLPAPPSRREVPDGKIGGLYLVVQPTGVKSWALRYRIAGVPKKYTIGPYPAIGLAAARRRALRALADVVDGNDPSALKKAVREAAKAATSSSDRVEVVVDSFVKKYLAKKAKPSWAKEAERLLKVEIVSDLGKKRLPDLTSDDIEGRLAEIAERAPITANRTLAVFRKLCNWAMTRDGGKLIAQSPCAGVRPPTDEKDRDRKRVLSDDEIRIVWQAFESIGWPFGDIGKLLLLTGARRNEVASMEWREIDLETCTWTLPAMRTKNRREHTIPLSAAAIKVLSSLPRIEGKAGLIFSTTGQTAVSGFSRAKAQIDAAILRACQAEAEKRGDAAEVKPPERWTLHDLRRTVATGLQALGIKLEVTENVLNHISGSRAGIVGIYQRFKYSAEVRTALEAWASHLNEIVSGPGV